MEPSKEAMRMTSEPKKSCSKPQIVPIHAETPGESTLETSSNPFPRDYILPVKDTINPINLSKYTKYELVEPEILDGVIVEEDMLGLIPRLKYAYHDIIDEKKFLELASSKFLKRYIIQEKKLVVIEPEIWEIWL
jgi:hypothetical protein